MAEGRRPRILIVDDSAVMRSLLRSVVCADAGLEVAGSAADGEAALRVIEMIHPDLILLDVEMPVKDGLATLRELRARGYKMPVIMCSSLTHRGAKVTIEALAGGASDYVTKPDGQLGREAAIQALAHELIPKIHALASQPQMQPPYPGVASVAPAPRLTPPLKAPPVSPVPVSSVSLVLAIGVSTGGPAALDVLLPALPADFPLPVMIVQHMPEQFTKPFAERLDGRCKLRVREAEEGDMVRAGTISIAKGNWHMEVLAAARGGAAATLHLNQGPLENHCRPAVDALFRSAAGVYGAGVLAVVLTGMGSDGLIGCRIVRGHGGSVLVQDQATSAVWGMPGAVANEGLAHKVLPLNAIVPEILRIASRTHSEARELRELAV
ncbi:MAG TPA: chemotaxis response regulator protein-glutamate methylesterase [Terracidiphilus sp.]|nr:chemotaxis response regulator protein-glutamate methylesterase [Terracidiphilus sp.]